MHRLLAKDVYRANLNASVGEHGYIRQCKYCGMSIYMLETKTGHFLPFESWKAGSVDPGDWVYHDCDAKPARRWRSLLPGEWECPSCHLAMPHSVRICENCGTSLSSRPRRHRVVI